MSDQRHLLKFENVSSSLMSLIRPNATTAAHQAAREALDRQLAKSQQNVVAYLAQRAQALREFSTDHRDDANGSKRKESRGFPERPQYFGSTFDDGADRVSRVDGMAAEQGNIPMQFAWAINIEPQPQHAALNDDPPLPLGFGAE
jgi:hypothetical protein